MVEPYRILIVEDDPEHAELIRIGFRRHDEFFLDFASTGEMGLEMIGCRFIRPHLRGSGPAGNRRFGCAGQDPQA